jgi:fucose permease
MDRFVIYSFHIDIYENISYFIGVFLYGFSISTAFPTSLALAETYVNLTGMLASFMVIGASFGEMVVPFLASQLIEVSLNSLIVVLFASAIGGLITYLMILYVGTKTPKHQENLAKKTSQTNLMHEKNKE